MRIVFLGPPGSGKGTQGKALSERLGVAHISTGDILRESMARGGELGRQAGDFVDSGRLVPDDLMVELVASRLAEPDARGGFVLDGFPRTQEQAAALDAVLARSGARLDVVLYLDVPDDVVVERLSGRRLCAGCGANYHVKFKPSDTGDTCDKCGGELYRRSDDEPDTVRKRLEVYQAQTAGLVDYYRRGGLLEKIDGDRPIEDIHGDVYERADARRGT
jgi:adenylate kinase